METIFEKIKQWFADAANGIGEVFARVFNASEKICVDGECLTAEDIRNLKQIAGIAVSRRPAADPGSGSATSSGLKAEGSDTDAPVIEMYGEPEVSVSVGASYVDRGAAIAGSEEDRLLRLITTVDGEEVEVVSIDPSAPGERVVRYRATDQAGNKGEAMRTVNINDIGSSDLPTSEPMPSPEPSAPEPAPEPVAASAVGGTESASGETQPAESSGEPQPEPAPAPAPEPVSEPTPTAETPVSDSAGGE